MIHHSPPPPAFFPPVLAIMEVTVSSFTNPVIGFKVDIKPVLEKEMATHSSTLAWKISWTEEPGGLQSMG